jgi:hypothetical protein
LVEVLEGGANEDAVGNLEYVTVTENYRHAKRTGLLSHHGSANGRAKVSEADVLEVRRLYALGARQVDLAEMFGVDQTSISRMVLGKGWVTAGH